MQTYFLTKQDEYINNNVFLKLFFALLKMNRTTAQQKQNIDFENTKIAFQNKSDKELNRTYWLFKIMASQTLFNIGSPLTKLAFKMHLPVKGLIKNTIYKQFCGGENIEDCQETIHDLHARGVSTILDYSVEGKDAEESFISTYQEVIKTIEHSTQNANISFCVFKPTGLGRFELLAKVSQNEKLSEEEKAEYETFQQRIKRICKKAYQNKTKLVIDAEHSWIQEPIDDVIREMMELYNKEEPIIYNTYQLYRQDKLASLKADFEYAKVRGFYLGVKIVRGAYMEIERARANKLNYPSPIQKNKNNTDNDFNEALLFCLDNLEKIAFISGTHNEKSSLLLVQEMEKRGIEIDHPHIYSSQLLGMSDNISFNLGKAGYNVAKYVPYGPVKAVIPYLIRRGQENTSVAGQTNREMALLIRERKRRKENK